jgi:glycosyltransferase involved in cell wall biosynthesis
LRCFPPQPFEQLAEVLGSADVLVAVLEADAGAFSVPSKILSYMCAGRAILGAIPRQNLAAQLITDHHAGIVVDPNDVAGFCRAAEKMLESPQERATYGEAARRYAENNFDLDRIADRFEQLFRSHAAKRAATTQPSASVSEKNTTEA